MSTRSLLFCASLVATLACKPEDPTPMAATEPTEPAVAKPAPEPGGVDAKPTDLREFLNLPATVGLIPIDAEVVFAVDPKQLLDSPVHAWAKDEPRLIELLADAKSCDLDPFEWDSAIGAVRLAGDRSAFVLVGDDLGQPEQAMCLMKAISDRDPSAMIENGGRRYFELGDDRVYLVDARTLAFAHGWTDLPGGPAIDNPALDWWTVLAMISGSSAAWIASRPSTELLGLLASTRESLAVLADAKSMSTALSIGDDASMSAYTEVVFTNNPGSKVFEAQIDTLVTELSDGQPFELSLPNGRTNWDGRVFFDLAVTPR